MWVWGWRGRRWRGGGGVVEMRPNGWEEDALVVVASGWRAGVGAQCGG